LSVAVVSAVGLAVVATAVYAGALRLAAPGLVAQLWRLRRTGPRVDVGSR
jgi:HAMP domain-containing protein